MLEAYAKDRRDQFEFVPDLPLREKEALLPIGAEPARAPFAVAPCPVDTGACLPKVAHLIRWHRAPCRRFTREIGVGGGVLPARAAVPRAPPSGPSPPPQIEATIRRGKGGDDNAGAVGFLAPLGLRFRRGGYGNAEHAATLLLLQPFAP